MRGRRDSGGVALHAIAPAAGQESLSLLTQTAPFDKGAFFKF